MSVTPTPADARRADLQLHLLRSYAAVVQQTRALPRILWMPVFCWRWLRFLRVPIPRVAISLFVVRHVRRVLDALEDVYQLRRATSEKGTRRDHWTEMHDQIAAMKAALPHRAMPTAFLALLALIVVMLAGQVLPKDDFMLFAQTIGAIVTLRPEKFVEIAAKPEAFWAIVRAAIWLFVIFVLLVPIIVCWFRCKRFLFNHPPPSGPALTNQTVVTLWQEQQTLRNSVYAVESGLFEAVGEAPLHEVPIDYYASMVVYVYFLASGLLLAIVALEPLVNSARFDSKMLLPFAALYAGTQRLLEYRKKIRNRRELASNPSRKD